MLPLIILTVAINAFYRDLWKPQRVKRCYYGDKCPWRLSALAHHLMPPWRMLYFIPSYYCAGAVVQYWLQKVSKVDTHFMTPVKGSNYLSCPLVLPMTLQSISSWHFFCSLKTTIKVMIWNLSQIVPLHRGRNLLPLNLPLIQSLFLMSWYSFTNHFVMRWMKCFQDCWVSQLEPPPPNKNKPYMSSLERDCRMLNPPPICSS